MKTHVGSVILTIFFSATVASAAAPQDNWFDLFRLPFSETGVENTVGLAITTNRLLVVADSGRKYIHVLDESGQTVTNWSATSGLISLVDIDVGDDGRIYLLRRPLLGGADVRIYSTAGTLLEDWGNTAASASGISATPDGNVVLTHSGSDSVGIYDSTGGVVQLWGSNGTGPGNFDDPRRVDVDAEGNIYVADYGNERIQKFDSEGIYLEEWNTLGSGGPTDVGVSPDGIIAFSRYYQAGIYPFIIKDAGLHILGSDGTQLLNLDPDSSEEPAAAACGPNGQLVAFSDADGIRLMQRGYRTQSAPAFDAVPIPRVLSVAQRLGTTYVDIDYDVIDPDDDTVTVAALAFDGSEQTLSTLVPMATLIEGTASNVGPGQFTGITNRLTWDAGSDWPTNQGSVTMRILAQDDRDLLGFHFITLPTNGVDPELIICRSPIVEEDFEAAWMWLVATNDPAIALSSGIVTAVSGPYSGQTLVHPGTTPPYAVTDTEAEPNGSTGAANSISITSGWAVVSGSGAYGDDDYFAFTIPEAGTRLWISVYAERIGSALDSRLYCYDPSGTQIASDRNTYGDDPYLEITCETNGTYTVHVARESYGGSGNYQLVVSTGPLSGTLANGLAFLWDRLGVTEATPAELTRAREASTPGSVTQWEPRNQIDGKPRALNEYGFDSGNWGANAWWVTQ